MPHQKNESGQGWPQALPRPQAGGGNDAALPGVQSCTAGSKAWRTVSSSSAAEHSSMKR